MRPTLDARMLQRVLRRDRGQDLLEYALLVALIALVAYGAVSSIGTTITNVFWTSIASLV